MLERSVTPILFDSVPHLPRQDDGSAIGPVVQYWTRLRNGRPVPPRAEIDPHAIQPYIGQSGIIERKPGGAVKIRLAGRRLEALMGMEMRGMPLRTLFAVAHRDRLEALLTEMFEAPRLLTLTLGAAFEGQPLEMAQMAVMPLSDMSGDITRALIVLTPQSAATDMPCRFHIRHAHLASVLAEAPAQPIATGRPQLRVIEGGCV